MSLVLQQLFDKLRACLDEHEALDRALANQPDGDADADGDHDSDDGEETAEGRELKRDYLVKCKEIDLLNKAVPEGLPEDGEFQYFLTLAELQKNIEELKVIKVMSEKNVAFMEQQFQLNENLILELKQKKEELFAKAESNASSTAAPLTQSEKEAEVKKKCQELDNRTRATSLAYKEFKSFLGQMLVEVAPDNAEDGGDGAERSRLAHLLQDLYDAFMNEGPETYVALSDLTYVDESDVATLLRHGIIERHPDSHSKGKRDKVRLVNFTE